MNFVATTLSLLTAGAAALVSSQAFSTEVPLSAACQGFSQAASGVRFQYDVKGTASFNDESQAVTFLDSDFQVTVSYAAADQMFTPVLTEAKMSFVRESAKGVKTFKVEGSRYGLEVSMINYGPTSNVAPYIYLEHILDAQGTKVTGKSLPCILKEKN